MAGIPEDLIVDILLRLPVKVLLRFRCVSKRWRNLIDSPNFVKSQLNLPNKSQFVMMLIFDKKLRIYYSQLDSDYIENPSPNFKELTIPCRDEILPNVVNFVGHCNGLLCFVCLDERSFLILNPCIGKHIQVPPPEQEGRSWWARGFGYDRDSDDYKVVAMPYFGDRNGVLWIYSLKSSTWKNIVDFPYIPASSTWKNIVDFPYIPASTNGVFLNGALHWIVRHYKRALTVSIIALNLGNLEYFSVPRPSDYSRNLSHFEVSDGCLYAIYSGYSEEYCYDLWVMKEYGLKESWTRLGTYDGLYDDREHLFFGHGASVVQRNFVSFWRKLIWRECRGTYKLQPSLVCARSGI